MMAHSSPAFTVDILDGIEPLAGQYDALFCDIWGVLHNGIESFAPAIDALLKFRDRGGFVVLISNAPRPSRNVLVQLEQLGIPPHAFDAVLTSGDISKAEITKRSGQRLYHIGPDRDLSTYHETGAVLSSLEEAEYVVCTGLFDDETDTVEDYRKTLEAMRRRNLWMLCANPDLVVERGNQMAICAGSIAAAYEEIGGEVYWAGKPHEPVYLKALEHVTTMAGRAIPKDRILAIGDAIRTDIAGAVNFGVDSLMVARGIHAHDLGAGNGSLLSPQNAQEWLARQAVRPMAIIGELAW